MRTQPRQPAAPNRDLEESRIEQHSEGHREDHVGNPYMEDDPFISMPAAPGRSKDITSRDIMQDSPLTASGQAPELDGQEELGPQLAWVSLDAPRGLLVCKNLDVEVTEFIGTIVESRVVRVMKDKDGGVFALPPTGRLPMWGGPDASAVPATTEKAAASRAGGSPGRKRRAGRYSRTPCRKLAR